MQVKIGYGHLFTLPIQQPKLHNIWFLNMEHPSHKIMWQMWFQLARILLCTKNVYWDEDDVTYVYFHNLCHCVLACWQTSMVANGIGITYVTKIFRQKLCKLYHKPQKLFNRKSLCMGPVSQCIEHCSHKKGMKHLDNKSIKVLWLIEVFFCITFIVYGIYPNGY